MFFGQFTGFMISVLIIAGLISVLIGELTDSNTIVVIVELNAVIGFVQKCHAEQAVVALNCLACENGKSTL